MFIEFLLGLFPFFRYTHWDAARNGCSDGKKSIPLIDQDEQPPYIMQLKNVGAEEITRLAQDWKRQDEKFLAQYCMTKQETETLREYLKKAKEDLEIASKDEEETYEEYVKHFHFAEMWYWIFVFGVAIFEFPLNSVVFQLFGENKIFTYLTAASLAVILPFCAHFLGGFLKQGFLREGRFSAHTVLTILMVVIPLTVLGGVAYLREKFFEGSGVQELLNLKMDETTVTITFFAINLLIFLVATVASYVAHDPVAVKYRHDLKDARKLKKSAIKRIKIYEHRLEENLERQKEISATRRKRFRFVQNRAEERREAAQVLMSKYHTYNLRVRDTNGQMPKCFKKFPPIDVPPAIEPGTDTEPRAELAWNCEEVLLKKQTGAIANDEKTEQTV